MPVPWLALAWLLSELFSSLLLPSGWKGSPPRLAKMVLAVCAPLKLHRMWLGFGCVCARHPLLHVPWFAVERVCFGVAFLCDVVRGSAHFVFLWASQEHVEPNAQPVLSS